MPELFPKISIIGCGNVGMRYTYALMIKGIARKIVLVDLDMTLDPVYLIGAFMIIIETPFILYPKKN